VKKNLHAEEFLWLNAFFTISSRKKMCFQQSKHFTVKKLRNRGDC